MELGLLSGLYAICRLPAETEPPAWVGGEFSSITVTPSEVSIGCEAKHVPNDIPAETGWRCLKVKGTLDLELTGVLASLAVPLAEAEVSMFSLSTFDTDYLLIKETRLEAALNALESAGHSVQEPA